MLPRELNYLQDMLDSARLARDFVAGIDREAFELDLMRQAAVTRKLEIIGEAARRISMETQTAIPAIPWPKIIGMRNRLVHEYDELDLEVIWDTVQLALPELINTLENIISIEEA
ncbi:DUF86 domain-containing protein [Pannus brasiliensis CCIBt3594]|uniref:DUF86 domain-containing protein n=1 Tax=Pannus brasiliensis CCIBt3594 TaxID=1427578 RepID=A0AAW9QKA7_9CHRO